MDQRIEFHIHPAYLAGLGLTNDQFYQKFMGFLMSKFSQPSFQRMTELANRIAARDEYGQFKVGFITLLAQMMRQVPDTERTRSGVEIEPYLLVALDIMAVADRIALDSADKIQIARSYWEIGRQAKSLSIPELAVTCYTRAAETYVSQGRWQQVGDLYWNIALAEAGSGFKPNAIGWLHLARDVFTSIGQQDVAQESLILAKNINANFEKYSVKRQRSDYALGVISKIHENVLHQSIPHLQGGQQSFIMLTEVPGIGRVATQGLLGKDGEQSWKHSFAMTDEIEYFERHGWPQSAVAAQVVDLRIIGRIVQTPELLDSLEPRALEIAIGKILEGFGATVRITPETRDGGFDVEAVFQIGNSKYRILFEAKKWKRERHVGIEVVDRLLGVQRRQAADHVCLVTTSTFSTVARQEAAKLQSEVTLVDRNNLLDWVREFLLPRESSQIALPSLRPRSS